MNTPDFIPLNLSCSGVELEQFIIRLSPTMEMAGLLIFQLVFNSVGFKLLDSVGDPVRVLGNPFLVVSVGVFLQGIPKFKPSTSTTVPKGSGEAQDTPATSSIPAAPYTMPLGRFFAHSPQHFSQAQ